MSRDRPERLDAIRQHREAAADKHIDQQPETHQQRPMQFGADNKEKMMGSFIKQVYTIVSNSPMPKPFKWILMFLLIVALGTASMYGFAASLF